MLRNEIDTENLRVGRAARTGTFHVIRNNNELYNESSSKHRIGYCGKHLTFNIGAFDELIPFGSLTTLCGTCYFQVRKIYKESLAKKETIGEKLEKDITSFNVSNLSVAAY